MRQQGAILLFLHAINLTHLLPIAVNLLSQLNKILGRLAHIAAAHRGRHKFNAILRRRFAKGKYIPISHAR